MEFRDAVFGRRSVRRYLPDQVSDEDLQYIIDAGMYAPSAMNLQPWYLVVVRSPGKMAELGAIMEETAVNMTPSLRERFVHYPEVAEETIRFIRCLGGAPVCILAFWEKKEYDKTDSSIDQSVAALIENMLLAATDRGLGSCWLTAPLEGRKAEAVHEAFAPEHGRLVAAVTVGYPETVGKAPARRKNRYTVV